MNDQLEDNLRRALARVEPPTGLAERILARLPAQPAAAVRPVPVRRNYWLPAAMAASLLASVLIGHGIAEKREERAGLAARQQLLDALRVTSEKLDLAYHAVKDEPENRT